MINCVAVASVRVRERSFDYWVATAWTFVHVDNLPGPAYKCHGLTIATSVALHSIFSASWRYSATCESADHKAFFTLKKRRHIVHCMCAVLQLQDYAILTKSLTAGFLFVAGDVFAQGLQRHVHYREKTLHVNEDTHVCFLGILIILFNVL